MIEAAIFACGFIAGIGFVVICGCIAGKIIVTGKLL